MSRIDTGIDDSYGNGTFVFCFVVDDASASVRTAIGDTHDDLFAVALVGDTQQCAEGIGAVGARKTVVMQALAATCARARGTFRIERSLACLRLSADKGEAYCCKNY